MRYQAKPYRAETMLNKVKEGVASFYVLKPNLLQNIDL